jgi:predicted transcriptional regulator
MLHTLPTIVAECNMAKSTLHMKIEADLKDRLRQLAEQENRSLSNLVEKALKDYAEQHKNR